MTISRLRLENISLFNYIKYLVISPALSEYSSGDTITYNPTTGVYTVESSLDPSPVSEGRGWVFFDDSLVSGRYVVDTSQEQTAKVVVTGPTTCTINYLTGSISNFDSEPTSVTYYWNYVSVLPGWPGKTPPPLPIVSISIDGTVKEGFQLGGGTRNLRTVYFDIFATSDAERQDITDVIHTALFNRTIPIYDFTENTYLNYDGTFNSGLTEDMVLQGNIRFIDVKDSKINISGDWSDINKFRSLVTGTYESLIDPV